MTLLGRKAFEHHHSTPRTLGLEMDSLTYGYHQVVVPVGSCAGHWLLHLHSWPYRRLCYRPFANKPCRAAMTHQVLAILVSIMHHEACTLGDIKIYNRESRDYAPLFVHANIGQNCGGGLYVGSLHYYQYRPECHVGAWSLAVWWAKFEKKNTT